MTTRTSTPYLRYENLKRLKDDIGANNYYLFAADCSVHPNNTVQDISDDPNDFLINVYKQMVFGKLVANTDLAIVTSNYPWTTGTLYPKYDDANTSLANAQFFVNVNEGSFYHLWKCLDNNNGANSTVSPSFAAGAGQVLYRTSDGYQWQYLASVDSNTVNKFSTTSYFPVVANTVQANTAVAGAFDVISVDFQGTHYNNYMDGTFQSTDIQIGGSRTLYAVSNSVAQSVNGYYTGCMIYISGGAGLGQYKTIVDYISNTSGNMIVIDSEFVTSPVSGTTYQIRPGISINPQAQAPTVNCIARALINSTASNAVYRVEILQRGSGYIRATANVVANSVVGVSNTAIIRPINGPKGGHSSDVYSELYANAIEISTTFSNSQSNTIPTTNYYQRIGLLKNPLFANVNLQLTGVVGSFTTGETLSAYTYSQIDSNVTCNLQSTLITCNTANFVNQLVVGEKLFIVDGANVLSQIVSVANVVNGTAFNTTSNVNFTATTAKLYTANIIANAVITTVSNTVSIFINNATPAFINPANIIGQTSFARAQIGTVFRNDIAKSYSTFIQLFKYQGVTVGSTNFIENETVVQGNATAQFFDFDTANTSLMYLTNFSGLPFTNGQILGNTSQAVANVTNKYIQELVPYSGEVLYVENISKVTRTNAQNETFQLILKY